MARVNGDCVRTGARGMREEGGVSRNDFEMTGDRARDSVTSLRSARRERQRTFWRERYLEDPAFFGRWESRFARWCLPLLRAERGLATILELGCGYGRDSRFLASEGYRVTGVDLTVSRSPGAPTSKKARSRLRLMESDAVDYLHRTSAGVFDAVYSNMFFNMDFTSTEQRSLMRSIRFALRPGGLHLYSARATSDPWYGRGRKIRADTYESTPGGVTIHFFSDEYADRLARGLFRKVRSTERSEGNGAFPIRLWYRADRRG